jgi:hypothetical protein
LIKIALKVKALFYLFIYTKFLLKFIRKWIQDKISIQSFISNNLFSRPPDVTILRCVNSVPPKHRGETYRVVTSVPTFFVRMLGKLLDACMTWWRLPKLAEYAQLIIFCPVAWKKVGTWKRKLPQCLQRSVTALYVSTLWPKWGGYGNLKNCLL